MKETCISCRFFTKPWNHADRSTWGADDRGECRRLPPQYSQRSATSFFVPVTGDMWCGEHRSLSEIRPAKDAK